MTDTKDKTDFWQENNKDFYAPLRSVRDSPNNKSDQKDILYDKNLPSLAKKNESQKLPVSSFIT